MSEGAQRISQRRAKVLTKGIGVEDLVDHGAVVRHVHLR